MTLSHFAFASDGNFLLQLQVAVASLLHACRHRPREIIVHVLDLGITDEAWESICVLWKRIMPQASFERHKIDASKYANYRIWHGSLAIYSRLDLPVLLPEVDWCFYFDCDALIVNDPDEVANLCRDDLAIIGHLDLGEADGIWAREHGLPFDPKTYVCGGVLLMNLAWFRRFGKKSACFDFLREYPVLPHVDQTVLNNVCQGHVGLLPSSWGVFVTDAVLEQECGCIHYAGSDGCQPWLDHFNLFHHCFDYQLLRLWRRFAVSIAGCRIPRVGVFACFMECVNRCMAITIVWALQLVITTGLYPAKYNELFERFDKRIRSKVADRCCHSMGLESC